MFRAIIRVLFGFILACIAAGVSQVLFAFGPSEVSSGDPERLALLLNLAAAAATQSAVFAAPLALVSAAVSEWQDIRSWLYHTVAGVVIAAAGFAAQYSSEAPGTASVFNNYALAAYMVTGLVAGLVYWVFAGRWAGAPERIYEPAPAVIASTGTVPISPPTSKTPAAPPPSPKSA